MLAISGTVAVGLRGFGSPRLEIWATLYPGRQTVAGNNGGRKQSCLGNEGVVMKDEKSSAERLQAGKKSEIKLRRADHDRRQADLPFEGPDRRKARGGFVVEIHTDDDGRKYSVVKRKKYLDRRRPTSIHDHQR
ncbi:hypothetical protein DFP90_105228 [Aestuariispira insulae]|uniref:Uncharacterized protein n=1 Tax=Aestuariispira insulae TaxID=1461337 RepID=A0A3D9HLT2_9PROT|nr:hypothetical protein DFP90_105228 [Aestuariispira insulae]